MAAAAAAVVAVLVNLSGAVPASADSTVLYVGGAGCTDSGQGTSTTPYCTINRASLAVTAGQVVEVAGGTYMERVVVQHSGTDRSPVVFRAASGAVVVVTGGSNGFFVRNRSHVTISGFTVTGTVSYGIEVIGSQGITISDNTVTESGHPVAGQTAAGIHLNNTGWSMVSGNDTNNNSASGIALVGALTAGVNVVHNASSWNASGYGRIANGIEIRSANNTVVANTVHDNEDSGIQFYQGANNGLAALNVVYNNGDHGIDNHSVSDGRIIGNTVYRNCTTGINVEGWSSRFTVVNNIAVDNAVYPAYRGIQCSRRGGNIGIWDTAPATSTMDSNMVWLTIPGVMYVFGASYGSMAALQAATGQEAHGMQADPLFVNAYSWDFRLGRTSPAIDAADSSVQGQPETDCVGNVRVDDPDAANTGRGPRSYDDRGAYEFMSAFGDAPIVDVAISPANGSPAVRPGTLPRSIIVDAAGSSDPQGEPLVFTFEFGDGTTVGPQADGNAEHTYQYGGQYYVRVVVANALKVSDIRVVPIIVDARGPLGYVAQIATNVSTNATAARGWLTVWRSEGVPINSLVVVTVELAGTASTGAVGATDPRGNSYAVAADVADGSGNRLVVLAGVIDAPLLTGDSITVTFPVSAANRLVADRLSGVTAVDQASTATGTEASFTSGPAAMSTPGSGIAFGVVCVIDASTAPVWAAGWTGLAVQVLGQDSLGRAYHTGAGAGANAGGGADRDTSASVDVGGVEAAGSASGAWLAICVTFRQ